MPKSIEQLLNEAAAYLKAKGYPNAEQQAKLDAELDAELSVHAELEEERAKLAKQARIDFYKNRKFK